MLGEGKTSKRIGRCIGGGRGTTVHIASFLFLRLLRRVGYGKWSTIAELICCQLTYILDESYLFTFFCSTVMWKFIKEILASHSKQLITPTSPLAPLLYTECTPNTGHNLLSIFGIALFGLQFQILPPTYWNVHCGAKWLVNFGERSLNFTKYFDTRLYPAVLTCTPAQSLA